jgi:hypothetical protein
MPVLLAFVTPSPLIFAVNTTALFVTTAAGETDELQTVRTSPAAPGAVFVNQREDPLLDPDR